MAPSFDGKLDADGLQVGGALFMRSEGENKASFKEVVLRGANIKDLIDMSGASFDGKFDADTLHVGGMLLMRSEGENKASFKEVDLSGANIKDQISMSGANFDGMLDADSLQVGGSLFMRDSRCAGRVVMIFAHVGSNLDLRGATLAGLDLSGASVAGDLRLGGVHYSAVWKKWRTRRTKPAQHAYRQSGGCAGCLAGKRTPLSRRVHLPSSWRIRRRNRTANAQPGNGVVGQLGKARPRL